MKICAACGHGDKFGKCETCPSCGEASWTDGGALPRPAAKPVAASTDDAEAPKKKRGIKKRGTKRGAS